MVTYEQNTAKLLAIGINLKLIGNLFYKALKTPFTMGKSILVNISYIILLLWNVNLGCNITAKMEVKNLSSV